MHQEFKILCVLSDIKRKSCRHCGVKAYVKYLVPEIINQFGKVEWRCWSSARCSARSFLLKNDVMVTSAKVTKIVKKKSAAKKKLLAERTEKYSSILVL